MRLFFLCLLFPLPALAAVPFPALNEDQRGYYIHSFNYAMESSKADDLYNWNAHAARGAIRAGEQFTSKSGSLCRSYSESYVTKDGTGERTGIACKRMGGEGWCRLKEGDALTCAMEKPGGGLMDQAMSEAAQTGDSWWDSFKRMIGF